MKQSTRTLYIKDANGTYLEATTDDVIVGARRKLRQRFRKGKAIRSPADTEAFLIAELATEPHEVFAVLYLDLCVALINVELGRRGSVAAWNRRRQLHITVFTAVAST